MTDHDISMLVEKLLDDLNGRSGYTVDGEVREFIRPDWVEIIKAAIAAPSKPTTRDDFLDALRALPLSDYIIIRTEAGQLGQKPVLCAVHYIQSDVEVPASPVDDLLRYGVTAELNDNESFWRLLVGGMRKEQRK